MIAIEMVGGCNATDNQRRGVKQTLKSLLSNEIRK